MQHELYILLKDEPALEIYNIGNINIYANKFQRTNYK